VTPEPASFELREIAPGVRLHAARDGRWKTTLALARIAASLAEDTTRSALIPFATVQGTGRLPTARAIARYLEDLLDAELEPEVVRLGDAQVLEWRLEVVHPRFAGGRRDTLFEGLALLGDVIYRPARGRAGRLRAEVIANEKKNLRAAILGLRDDRVDYAVEACARLLGRGEPSGRFELGAVEEIAAIGAADATARWHELVLARPLDILVIGDHTAEEVERAVRAGFPLEERRPAPEQRALGPAVPAAGGRPFVRQVERARVAQAQVCLGFRTGTSYLGDGYAELLVFNAAFGGDGQSRLYRIVRERHGLAYEARTIHDRLKGTITVHCGVAPENVERVEALVLAELERLQAEPLPPDELAEARRFVVERLHEIADDAALALAFEHAKTLAGRRGVTVADLGRRVEAVSAEGAREAARKLALDCAYVLTRR
jgi:predicted Zn-dependent peptidase